MKVSLLGCVIVLLIQRMRQNMHSSNVFSAARSHGGTSGKLDFSRTTFQVTSH